MVLTKASAQNYRISPEINMRNDFAYYLIPFQNTCVLVRDKSYRTTFQTLREDFNWSVEKDLELIGKKWKVLDAFSHDLKIGIIYLAKTEEKTHLVYSTFDQNGIPDQHWVPDLQFDPDFQAEVNFVNSENKKYVSVGIKDKHGKRWIVSFDRMKQGKAFCKPAKELFNFDDYTASFAVLSNEGFLYLLGTEKHKVKRKQTATIKVQGIGPSGEKVFSKIASLHEADFYDIEFKINNQTGELIMAGLYSEEEESQAEGYIYFNFTKGEELIITPFDKELMKSWGLKGNELKQSQINLSVRELKFKEDGGLLVFFENSKELMRRPYFNNAMDPTGIGSVRWVDYYYDDILALSFDQNGKKQWEEILRKRQFSQDDQGLYSSFYIVSNPSFLRILFNDEIKNESTVSEYILLPDGKNYRKSILNTGALSLNLRIQDAQQISSNTVWVPSESGGKMVLVKIDL
ncbi:MAG: hypothetical protein IPM48_04895 [Saprospiraceae bacterium]|nr:hypothetical protein [Saprospiraceae bacterium]